MIPALDHTKLPPNCRVVVIPDEQHQKPSRLFDSLPDVCTAQEAAEALSICDKQVRELAAQGKLTGFKVGKLWRFTRSSLIDFVDKGGTNG